MDPSLVGAEEEGFQLFTRIQVTTRVTGQNLLTSSQQRALNDIKCYLNTEDYHFSDYQALLCPAGVRGFASDRKAMGLLS